MKLETKVLVFGHSSCMPKLTAPAGVELVKVCVPEWQEAWGGSKPSNDTHCIAELNHLIKLVEYEKPEVGLCIGSKWIFDRSFLNLFPQGFFNTHPSMLPRYAGAGGASWQTMGSEPFAKVTIHKMEIKIDLGAIAIQEEKFVGFEADNRARGEAIQELTELAVEKFLRQVGTKTLTLRDNKLRMYLPALRAHTNGAIDWNWSTDEIIRFCRSFDKPHAGAFTYFGDTRVVVTDVAKGAAKGTHPFMSGLLADDDLILTRDGSIKCKLSEKLKIGSRLWTPQDKLDEARRYRP